MKCYASKPQQTRRLAGQVNILLQTISSSEKLPIKTDIQQKSKVQYVCRMIKRVISREPGAHPKLEAKKEDSTR